LSYICGWHGPQQQVIGVGVVGEQDVTAVVENLSVPGQIDHQVIVWATIGAAAEPSKPVAELLSSRAGPEDINMLIPARRRQQRPAQQVCDPFDVVEE
jgi:hypothetical protein